MKITSLLPLLLFCLLISCSQRFSKQPAVAAITGSDSSFSDSAEFEKQMEATLRTLPKNIKPVFGYRFIIEGDFDGDGKKEKLAEHFFSGLDHKETNKFYDSLPEYEQLIALTVHKKPISFVSCTNPKIDTLLIASQGQLLGLSMLRNEGDLDGDGGDEISYVVNWADFSNINTCYLMTCKDHHWQELYSFGIWDWQLPDLPETFSHYGLFGTEGKEINTNDTVNQRLEKELNGFSGLIRKLQTNRISITYRNEEAMEDTKIVDLARLKK